MAIVLQHVLLGWRLCTEEAGERLRAWLSALRGASSPQDGRHSLPRLQHREAEVKGNHCFSAARIAASLPSLPHLTSD